MEPWRSGHFRSAGATQSLLNALGGQERGVGLLGAPRLKRICSSSQAVLVSNSCFRAEMSSDLEQTLLHVRDSGGGRQKGNRTCALLMGYFAPRIRSSPRG